MQPLAAKAPDLGVGPYGVVRNDEDSFYYITLAGAWGITNGGPYPLGKTAYKRARQLNDAWKAEQLNDAWPGDFLDDEPAQHIKDIVGEAPLIPYGEIPTHPLDIAAAHNPGDLDDLRVVHVETLDIPAKPADPALILFNGTREEWLNAFVAAARPEFERVGSPLPEKVRVSIGWTSIRKAGGECWSADASADGFREIFIAPDSADPRWLAGILTHELCHAALPHEAGHKKPFKQLGNALGLVGKAIHLIPDLDDPESPWAAWADPILAKLGPIPHAKLDRALSGKKKQTTRLIKAECETCGFVGRLTAKWVNKAEGILECPDADCFVGEGYQDRAGERSRWIVTVEEPEDE